MYKETHRRNKFSRLPVILSGRSGKSKRRKRKGFGYWLAKNLLALALIGVFLWWWSRSQQLDVEKPLEFELDEAGPAAGGLQPEFHPGPDYQVAGAAETPPELWSKSREEPYRTAEIARETEVPATKPEERETQPDDLRKIEGIGPKITAVLQDAGIDTFEQLAKTDVDRLVTILREAGIPIADPTTWPEQARLAAAGDEEGLQYLQRHLNAGRRV